MEEPVVFENKDEAIRGVLHVPAESTGECRAGILFLHGWSGCRLGPHRMFVKTARRLCSLGYACLRFDFRGRGDSDGAAAVASIGSMTSDAARALEFFAEKAGLNEVVLIGICSGCKVAIGVAVGAKRVRRMVLWSAEPMGRLKGGSRAGRKSAFALHEYARKAFRGETWRKLLTGRVNLGLVRKVVLGHETSSGNEIRQETKTLEEFCSFPGSIAFIHGTNDPETAAAANSYEEFCSESGITSSFHAVHGANHSFYSIPWERQVMEQTENWVAGDALPAPE